MKLRIFGCLFILGLPLACQGGKGGGSTPVRPVDPGPDPANLTCVEKQKSILERSGWNLTQSLGDVIDALLQQKATQEQLPVCTLS